MSIDNPIHPKVNQSLETQERLKLPHKKNRFIMDLVIRIMASIGIISGVSASAKFASEHTNLGIRDAGAPVVDTNAPTAERVATPPEN